MLIFRLDERSNLWLMASFFLSCVVHEYSLAFVHSTSEFDRRDIYLSLRLINILLICSIHDGLVIFCTYEVIYCGGNIWNDLVTIRYSPWCSFTKGFNEFSIQDIHYSWESLMVPFLSFIGL